MNSLTAQVRSNRYTGVDCNPESILFTPLKLFISNEIYMKRRGTSKGIFRKMINHKFYWINFRLSSFFLFFLFKFSSFFSFTWATAMKWQILRNRFFVLAELKISRLTHNETWLKCNVISTIFGVLICLSGFVQAIDANSDLVIFLNNSESIKANCRAIIFGSTSKTSKRAGSKVMSFSRSLAY